MEEKSFVLSEETYFEEMWQTVLPYLAQRKKELWLEREPGKRQYCVRYLADEAKGTVIVSHGFTKTAEKYQEAVWYFLKHGYNVYVPEHCGHGHSYRLTEGDLSLVHVDHYERYVADLLAVAERAAKEQKDLPLFLYAHSMGGGVGAAALSRQPGLFSRAVLSSPMIRPLTAGVPWSAASLLAGILCRIGRSKQYVPGGHAFDGQETFEDSASTCRERFSFYQKRRNEEPLYQVSVASCGWLHEAARLNRYLQSEGWKRIETPTLIFQAEDDTFVSGKEQERFAEKLNRKGKTSAKLVRMPGTRHEIYNSASSVLERYWEEIFAFFSERTDIRV